MILFDMPIEFDRESIRGRVLSSEHNCIGIQCEICRSESYDFIDGFNDDQHERVISLRCHKCNSTIGNSVMIFGVRPYGDGFLTIVFQKLESTLHSFALLRIKDEHTEVLQTSDFRFMQWRDARDIMNRLASVYDCQQKYFGLSKIEVYEQTSLLIKETHTDDQGKIYFCFYDGLYYGLSDEFGTYDFDSLLIKDKSKWFSGNDHFSRVCEMLDLNWKRMTSSQND